MFQRSLFTVLFTVTTLFTPIRLMAQNDAYEIDKVKMIPALDESSMRNLALSVWEIYDLAMVHPEILSTPKALENRVYAFYDTEFEGRHDKLGAVLGSKYECADRKRLDSNDRLLFNMNFDASGAIIIPDTLYIISNRLQEREGKVYTIATMAFAIPVPVNMREKFGKVKLERIVKGREQVVPGEFPPVEVIVPFNLARRVKTKLITGKVMTEDDKISFMPEATSFAGENEQEVLKALSESIEAKLVQYKKGDFNFIVEHTSAAYQIDMNIRRNTIWHSTQTKNFSIDQYRQIQFNGTGEKTKQYTSAQKAVNERLAKANQPGKK